MIKLDFETALLTLLTILIIINLKNYSTNWKVQKLVAKEQKPVKKLSNIQLILYSPGILGYFIFKLANLALKIIIYTILDYLLLICDWIIEFNFTMIFNKLEKIGLTAYEKVKGLSIKFKEHLSHLYWTSYHDNIVKLINYVQLNFNKLLVTLSKVSESIKNYTVKLWSTTLLPKIDNLIATILIPLLDNFFKILLSCIIYINTKIIPVIKKLDFSKLIELIHVEWILFNLIPLIFNGIIGIINFLVNHSSYLVSITKIKELATYCYPIIVKRIENGAIKTLDYLESDGLPKAKQLLTNLISLTSTSISFTWSKFCHILEFYIVPGLEHLITTLPKIYNWANHKYNLVKPYIYSIYINQILPSLIQLTSITTYLHLLFISTSTELIDIGGRLWESANNWYENIMELDGVIVNKMKKE